MNNKGFKPTCFLDNNAGVITCFSDSNAGAIEFSDMRSLLSMEPPEEDFGEFEGNKVDKERLALHVKAVNYTIGHPGTDYMTAVMKVKKNG